MTASKAHRGPSGGLAALLVASIAVAAIALCPSCSSGSGGETPGAPKEPAVYVSGYYIDGSNPVPCYWKGTTRTDLPVDPALGISGGKANAIAVSGGTVYAGGVQLNASAVGTPCYWTGTTRVDLYGDGAGVKAIRVSGGKVYSALTGYWDSIEGDGGAYFVDSTLNIAPHLPSGTGNSVCCLDIEDGKVYLGGYEYVSGNTRGALWVDGAPTQLDAAQSTVYGLKASGGIAYAVGVREVVDVGNMACCWKGATSFDLPCEDTAYPRASGVDVVDGTAYTVGWYMRSNPGAMSSTVACYWTDAARTDLPGDSGEGNAIAVYGGTVYSAGYYNDGAKDVACYWRGTDRVELSGSGTGGCYATGIALVEE
jgi:hypothetical protein